jgi:hypothetical protein
LLRVVRTLTRIRPTIPVLVRDQTVPPVVRSLLFGGSVMLAAIDRQFAEKGPLLQRVFA